MLHFFLVPFLLRLTVATRTTSVLLSEEPGTDYSLPLGNERFCMLNWGCMFPDVKVDYDEVIAEFDQFLQRECHLDWSDLTQGMKTDEAQAKEYLREKLVLPIAQMFQSSGSEEVMLSLADIAKVRGNPQGSSSDGSFDEKKYTCWVANAQSIEVCKDSKMHPGDPKCEKQTYDCPSFDAHEAFPAVPLSSWMKHRLGDCRIHALLLLTLMARAGFDAPRYTYAIVAPATQQWSGEHAFVTFMFGREAGAAKYFTADAYAAPYTKKHPSYIANFAPARLGKGHIWAYSRKEQDPKVTNAAQVPDTVSKKLSPFPMPNADMKMRHRALGSSVYAKIHKARMGIHENFRKSHLSVSTEMRKRTHEIVSQSGKN